MLKEGRRGDLIEAYKTLNGKNQVEKSEWFEIKDEQSRPMRENIVVENGSWKKK